MRAGRADTWASSRARDVATCGKSATGRVHLGRLVASRHARQHVFVGRVTLKNSTTMLWDVPGERGS